VKEKVFTSIRYPFATRTSVTNELWQARETLGAQQAGKEHGTGPITARPPGDSFLDITLPFSSDPALREQYISPFGHIRCVSCFYYSFILLFFFLFFIYFFISFLSELNTIFRIGRILEDLDALAGSVAYMYVYPGALGFLFYFILF
jgi:hypothetical protein